MATKRLLGELVDAYKSTAPDLTIAVESMGGVDAARRVAAGEPYDLAVLASGALEKLIAQGHIVAGSRVDVVKSPVAFAVRAGAPRPEIDSEAVSYTHLRAHE